MGSILFILKSALLSAATAASVSLAWATGVAPGGDQIAAPAVFDRPAEEIPMGVDPMVTGPVSASFKARQTALRCESAVWPNIPNACYPD